VKRPWLHLFHNAALREFVATTEAKVVISLRPFDGMRGSWNGNGSWAVDESQRLNAAEIYKDSMASAFALEKEGLAITTWLPFLSQDKHALEIDRIERWCELPSGARFVKHP
jgi:hypothetical protein